MKKKLKKLFYLSLLLSGLVIAGCELQEDVIENHNHQQKIIFSSKQFSELIDEKKFSNSFSKIPKRKTSTDINGRSVIEESYGFTIYDAPVQVIESDSLISYTLLIQSDETNKDENIVENLIINEYPIQNTTSIFTIKYAFDPLVKIDETNFHSLKHYSTVTPLVIENKVFTEEMRGMMECIRVQELMCCHDPNDNLGGCHTPFGQCYKDNTVFWGTVSVNCSSGGGGPSGNYGPTEVGNTGPGPHGGSPTTGNVYTSPVPLCKIKSCPPIGDLKNNPCENLKELSKNSEQNIDPSINDLKQKLAEGVTNEWGVQFKHDTDVTPAVYSNILVSGNGNTAPFRSGWNYRGGAHIHTNEGYGMFSWVDVRNLFKAYSNTNPEKKDLVTNIMVCNISSPLVGSNSYNIYAIKVDDIIALENQINTTWNNPLYFVTPSGDPKKDESDKIDLIHLAQEKEFIKHLNTDNLSVDDCLTKAFLNQFITYGISLYKKNNDTNNWERITFDPLTNTILKTPCN